MRVSLDVQDASRNENKNGIFEGLWKCLRPAGRGSGFPWETDKQEVSAPPVGYLRFQPADSGSRGAREPGRREVSPGER